MKTVLVPLVDAEDTAALLSAAAAVATEFDASVEGFCFKPTFATPAYFEAVPAAVDERFEEDYRERAAALRRAFFEALEAAGVPAAAEGAKPGERGARWVDDIEGGYGYVTRRARLFDLAIVPQGVPGQSHHALGVFEAALFETGRPVLVTPRSEVAAFGRNIVVVWNGSDESVRAIVFALPFLRKAGKVTVLSVEGAMVPGPAGGEIAAYLAHQGITAEAVHAHPKDVSAGQAILDESAALGADLLVKGAYTQSRLRQMIFGGPTRHILEHASIPVLMAH